MAEYLDVERVAELSEDTVVLAADGGVAQAQAGPEADYRWAVPGQRGDLLSAAELVEHGQWRVLRYGPTSVEARGPSVDGLVLRVGPTSVEAPESPVDGLVSFSNESGLLQAIMTGEGVTRPVAMCVSTGWATSIAAALNAVEVEGYPAVVAATRRVVDLQAEYGRREKARDRVEDNVRQVLAGIVGALNMGPLSRFGVGLIGALRAIGDEAIESREALQQWESRANRLADELWPHRSTRASVAEVLEMLAAEVRTLRTPRRHAATAEEHARDGAGAVYARRILADYAPDVDGSGLDLTGLLDALADRLRELRGPRGPETVPVRAGTGGTEEVKHG